MIKDIINVLKFNKFSNLELSFTSSIVFNSSIKNVLLPINRTLFLYKIKTYELLLVTPNSKSG